MFALRNAVAGPSRLRSSAVISTTSPMALAFSTASASPSSSALASASASARARASPIISTARSFSSSPVSLDKLKSHSGTKKRFSRTGNGLFKRGQAGKRHLNTLFSAQRINRLGKTVYASITQSKVLRKLLPYA